MMFKASALLVRQEGRSETGRGEKGGSGGGGGNNCTESADVNPFLALLLSAVSHSPPLVSPLAYIVRINADDT